MNTRGVVPVLLVLAGCASRDAHPASPATADEEPVRMEATSASAMPTEEPPRAPPRLARTVTLGQGQGEDYSDPRAAPAPPASGGSGVVVNNTVVVQPAYGGYGYGYGYGGYYGGYGNYGYGGSREGRGARTGSSWGASGWEGAQRTAPAGRTPAVGGNWSPPPSYGPAPMR